MVDLDQRLIALFASTFSQSKVELKRQPGRYPFLVRPDAPLSELWVTRAGYSQA
jgi:hypothetical protein